MVAGRLADGLLDGDAALADSGFEAGGCLRADRREERLDVVFDDVADVTERLGAWRC